MNKKNRRCRFCIYFTTAIHGGKQCWACSIQEFIENEPDYKHCHKFTEAGPNKKQQNQSFIDEVMRGRNIKKSK